LTDLDIPQGKIWQVEWGDHTVEFGQFNQTRDPAPLFTGLPDDRCQYPHWGYVIKGRLRYRFKERARLTTRHRDTPLCWRRA